MYPELPDKEAVFAYVQSKDSELSSEVQQRLFGVKNATGGYTKVGYTILRKYFDGDQWDYSREAGSTMSVVNFCRMTVHNYTAFLTQEEPEIDIPPKDVQDDVEVSRVKEVETLIKDILDDNEFYNIFYGGVQNASLLGDSMLFGPFYDEKEKRIRFNNVKRPEYVRIIWKNEEYNEILGFIYHYYLAVEKAWEMFKDDLQAVGIKDIRALMGRAEVEPVLTTDKTQFQKVIIVREFWDEQVRSLDVANKQIKYDEHNFGFVPMIYVPNFPHPTDSGGISDIEDLIDPQRIYNEQTSDMQDIIKQVAFASIFGKNIEVEEIQAGVSKIYDMGDESEVFPDPRNTNFPFLQTFLSDKKQDIDITSGVPDVFQGGKGVRDVSGRALSVLMTPINNRVRSKEKRWSIALKTLVKNIEILIEKYVPGGKDLIQQHYKVDVFFPGTLVRDVTEELNKFIQKVQSQYTTMKNIGIASPKDEQMLMKKELSDLTLAAEISRAPQMQMMLAQQAIQAAMAKKQAGQAQERAGAQPTLSEYQNQGGEMPMSANNVPVGTTVNPAAAAATSPGNPALIPNQ
jgi:hypothetical protein